MSPEIFFHPFWIWLAVAAVLLALELATGSGYLLWPSASAGVVAVLTLFGVRLGWAGEAVLFAALTIASTYLAKRYFPRRLPSKGPDLNDARARLVGHEGHAVTGFSEGRGRVFVEGKEWAAELDGSAPPIPGERVRVIDVLGGAKLRVRSA
jgi:membrane protein implicated in regulation of membrane protease activity